MQFHRELEHSTIRRLYEQGLDSIVRLVSKLEDRILHLEDLQCSDSMRTVERLSEHIQDLQQTVENKSRELCHVHQLNHTLVLRIRELEQFLEQNDETTENAIKRNSHNSNQPPSLDAPWDKPKRTRSLRKKSNRKPGGQFGHHGFTLLQDGNPDQIIVHSIEACSKCGCSIQASDMIARRKRQVFEVADGSLSVIEHQVWVTRCPVCRAIARPQFPVGVNAPTQYGTQARAKSLYLHFYQLIPFARTAEAMRDLFACAMSPATVLNTARRAARKLIRSEQRYPCLDPQCRRRRSG